VDSVKASGKEDLRQRLEDRDQAHTWIQAKLQVRRTSGRGWRTEIRLSFR
jgi:hypothetical protein